MLFVVGGGEENEILLFGVVLALRDSLSILLKSVAAFSFPLQLDVPFFLSVFSFFSLGQQLTAALVCLFRLQEFDRQTHSYRKL